MKGYESAMFRGPKTVRKALTGHGMVAPTKSVTVTYESGRRELLKAGLTRLVPDHPLVRQRPGLFAPCDASDKATAARMAEYAGTRTRVLERARTQPRPTRKYGRHQIRRKQQQSSRLR